MTDDSSAAVLSAPSGRRGPSRRSLLAAPFLMALPGRALASDVDVAIVGAGAAGIAAARTLRALKLRHMVVEADARSGGRLDTDTSLGPRFDAGGAFIHFASRNPWTALAEENGITPVAGMRFWAGARVFRNGQPLSPAELAERWRAIQTVGEAYEEVEEESDMAMATVLAGLPQAARDAGRIQAQMAAGEDPERVSVADWGRLEGGDNRLVPGGYGALAAKVAADLPVRHGERVVAIAWDGPGVVLTMASGATLRARTAIVTVSVGVLQAGGIRFSPVLPRETLRALDGLRMNAAGKLALRFEGARFDLEPHAFLAEVGRPNEAITFEAWPQDQDLVVATVGGDYARSLARAGERVAVAEALDRLAAILGGDIRAAFRAGRLRAWSADPLHRGGYAVAAPGRTRAREALARPVAERIWFAGEAAAGAFSMTAGGAALAGEQAARQIGRLLTTGSLR